MKIKEINNAEGPTPKLDKFWGKVKVVEDAKSCWEWQGSRDKDGYGRIGVSRKDFKKTFKAHRLSWELQNGPIPPENCICHRCDNPPCVRPDHLELGTVYDNNHDKEKKNRQVRGEKNGMKKLTEREINEIRRVYDHGKLNQTELAEIFGVSQSAISKIIRMQRWTHVGEFADMFGKKKEKGIE